MLMAELTTAAVHNLLVEIIVPHNNSLAEVKYAEHEIGNPAFGCDLAPIDFVAFARACGAEGFRCAQPAQVRSATQAALNSTRAARLEAVVHPNEKSAKPDELKI
jgi:pyruvate dehydrogenase (quinone)